MGDEISTRQQLALKIGESVLSEYMGTSGDHFRQPFGSVSKSQLEAAIFSGLVQADFVKTDEGAFQLGVLLKITPSRARSLVFNHLLRYADDRELTPQDVRVDLNASDAKNITFIVDDLFAREALLAEFRQRGIYPKRDIEPARLIMDADRAVEGFANLFGQGWASALKDEFEASSEKVKSEVAKGKRAPYLTEVFGVLFSLGASTALQALGMKP